MPPKARPDANLVGVTVESMAHVKSARELLIGASRDPVFGPTMVFGAGGTMVEVLKDSAVALPTAQRHSRRTSDQPHPRRQAA